VRATGLRVITPGESAPRYVKRPLATCAARAPRGQEYLRVHAIQAGAGTTAGTVAAYEPAPGPARSSSPAHPAGPFARLGNQAD
jgi:hypothetical protein